MLTIQQSTSRRRALYIKSYCYIFNACAPLNKDNGGKATVKATSIDQLNVFKCVSVCEAKMQVTVLLFKREC